MVISAQEDKIIWSIDHCIKGVNPATQLHVSPNFQIKDLNHILVFEMWVESGKYLPLKTFVQSLLWIWSSVFGEIFLNALKIFLPYVYQPTNQSDSQLTNQPTNLTAKQQNKPTNQLQSQTVYKYINISW